MKRWRMFLAAGMLAFTLSACGNQAEGTAYVQSVSVVCGMGAVGMSNTYAGVVSPQNETEIKKSGEETVAQLCVKVGDQVQKGQVLFVYDTDQVQMNLEKGRLELEQLKNTISAKQKEKTQLANEKNSVSADQQLQYTLEIQEADAAIMEAQYNVSVKEKEIAKLEETLASLEVKSEVDGVVQSINENGETDDYGNEKPYMTIVETGTYRIKGYVNEMNAYNLTEGMEVTIHSRVDDSTWTGTIEQINLENPVKQDNNMYYDSSSSDDTVNSNKYEFYVALDQADGLMMGQHVYMQIGENAEDASEGGINLPSYYLNDVEDSPWVWVQNKKGKLEKREVELGEYLEEMDAYQITSGLEAEDYIAYPEDILKEGMLCTQYEDTNADTGMDEGVEPLTDDMSDDVDEGAEALTDEADGEAEPVTSDGATSTLEVQ